MSAMLDRIADGASPNRFDLAKLRKSAEDVAGNVSPEQALWLIDEVEYLTSELRRIRAQFIDLKRNIRNQLFDFEKEL